LPSCSYCSPSAAASVTSCICVKRRRISQENA
jgi:hypothetical protein